MHRTKSEICFNSSLSMIGKTTSQVFMTNLNEPKQIKFNGSKRFLKATTNDLMNESIYKEPKTSIKCSSSAYIDHLNDPNPQSYRQIRKKKPQTLKKDTQSPRGYGDFGAFKNRLKIVQRKADCDPITQDKTPSYNKNTSAIWESDRRQRDNGAMCKNVLGWQPQKTKSTYLQMHKAKQYN